MKTKIFPLTNLVLYAKGWYEKTDDIWDDLKKILELDNYSPFTKGDVYSIILARFSEFECRQSELREVLLGIHPFECWKSGYYTKNSTWVKDSEKLPEYDMPTAFIKYVLSSLMMIDNTQWNPQTPKYTKFPRPAHITINRVYEMFGRKKITV